MGSIQLEWFHFHWKETLAHCRRHKASVLWPKLPFSTICPNQMIPFVDVSQWKSRLRLLIHLRLLSRRSGTWPFLQHSCLFFFGFTNYFCLRSYFNAFRSSLNKLNFNKELLLDEDYGYAYGNGNCDCFPVECEAKKEAFLFRRFYLLVQS